MTKSVSRIFAIKWAILFIMVSFSGIMYVNVAEAARLLASNVELRGNYGKCLDIRGPSKANGTDVQLYECQHVPQQRWDIWDNGEIRSRWADNKCLDIENAGHIVQIYTCVGVPQQKWLYSGGMIFSLDRRNGTRCLDVINGSGADGASVQVYPCILLAPQQRWWQRKTVLRHSFSISHAGRFNLATEVPLSCYQLDADNHHCRYVLGAYGDTKSDFYWIGRNNALEQSSHPRYGRLIIDKRGVTYEGCALIYRWNIYRCDYKTGGHFHFEQNLANQNAGMNVFWEWARYTGDQVGCAAAIATLWRARGWNQRGPLTPLALVACDHGPLVRQPTHIPGIDGD